MQRSTILPGSSSDIYDECQWGALAYQQACTRSGNAYVFWPANTSEALPFWEDRWPLPGRRRLPLLPATLPCRRCDNVALCTSSHRPDVCTVLHGAWGRCNYLMRWLSPAVPEAA